MQIIFSYEMKIAFQGSYIWQTIYGLVDQYRNPVSQLVAGMFKYNIKVSGFFRWLWELEVYDGYN
jgi:hypothetical protein